MSRAFWRLLEPTPERDALIEATLSHVPFDGWGQKALLAGAADLGVAAEAAERAFPGGALDLIAYHSARADRNMPDALSGLDLPSLGVRQRIVTVVRARLEANTAAREAIRAAMGTLALPPNLPIALALLYRTVDAMWWAIGDSTTTFGFYTKRLTLAGVYLSTLTFWLGDRSEGCNDTWAFLDRRIEDVMRNQKLRGGMEAALPDLPGLFRAFRQATTGHRTAHRRQWPTPDEKSDEPPPPPKPER
jgi:ubiquinone biosynthesis protein COQ9